METIIVYVDDAAYAQPLLAAAAQAPSAAHAHWIVVACAPRITHRVSRFVSNRTRENWRNKWADKLFEQVQPVLQGKVARVTTLLARVPLQELMQALQAEHGPAQIVDLRRPKMHSHHSAAPATAPAGPVGLPKLVGTLSGVGAVWTVLVGDVLAA